MAKFSGRLDFFSKKTNFPTDYIRAENLKKRHPDGDYSIIGEVFVKGQSEKGMVKKTLENGRSIHVQPIGTYNEKKYKTLGYILCKNKEYIAVKKKKCTTIVVGSILGLLLLLMVLGGILLMNNKPDIDPNAGEYASSLKRPDNIGDSKILIPGYGKFTLKKGSDTIDTVLFNPEGNPCFFKFTLMERTTNEVVYESKLVPPGQGIAPIKLKKIYNDAGEYDLVLKFQSVDLENTKITYNGSDIDVKLKVID